MDTAPLKTFASLARTTLLAEIEVVLARALAEGSTDRLERPRQVAALQAELDRVGKTELVAQAAYTWFNRLIALRYMDARGYTGIGVVSPAADGNGVQTQPEILAEAEHGNIDSRVVSPEVAQRVQELLLGTSESGPNQEEAYRLLLLEYCRFWNKRMPFMFETAGDYTELLTPLSLLADTSVRAETVKTMSAEVCEEGVEVIGWLYQFYIADRKDEVYASFKKGTKAGTEEIPAATQLFTPSWIVRYLVENSVGRLWLQNHPASNIRKGMDYYIDPPEDEEPREDYLQINSPEELRIIDPACGSGHMLTYTFDLLCEIYEEEGYAPSEIPGLILANNLFGTEIDQRAQQLAAFALSMKARERDRRFFNQVNVEGLLEQPNVIVIEPIEFTGEQLDYLLDPHLDEKKQTAFWQAFTQADLLGSLIKPDQKLIPMLQERVQKLRDGLVEKQASLGGVDHERTLKSAERVLIQAEYLRQKYHAVVANPPYLGSGSFAPQLKQYIDSNYQDGKRDLYAVFMLRGFELLYAQGFLSMVTMQAWMFLSSFEQLRKALLGQQSIISLAHLGTNAFDAIGGDVVSTTCVVWNKDSTPGAVGTYFRLIDLPNEATKRDALLERAYKHVLPQTDFEKIPGSPIVYWLSPSMLELFAENPPLESLGKPRVGLQTGNNNKFLRFWWEVATQESYFSAYSQEEATASGVRWFPLNKGGSYRKWWGNQDYLVNWKNEGAAIRGFGTETGGKQRSVIRNPDTYYHSSVSWSHISSGDPGFRFYPKGFIYGDKGPSLLSWDAQRLAEVGSICNSSIVHRFLAALSPTIGFNVGEIARVPIPKSPLPAHALTNVEALIATSRSDWDRYETSWDFTVMPLEAVSSSLEEQFAQQYAESMRVTLEQQAREEENNLTVARAYGLEDEVPSDVPLEKVSLTQNPVFRYGKGKSDEEYRSLYYRDMAADLVSYAVGCMFGRYSLDEPGLILGDQGSTLDDYYAKVAEPSFAPDASGVIPITDGEWFADDIAGQLNRFLRTAFGDEHVNENWQWLATALGVRDLRAYFPGKFWADHLKRYKNRPIYWLFTSAKGGFNALIYMHRYTPGTASTILNDYLQEYAGKLKGAAEQAQGAIESTGATTREVNAARKELTKMQALLRELDDYERNVMYPLASRRLDIDLDDGVRVNYPKFYPAVKKIPGV